MADLASYGNAHRDIDQFLLTAVDLRRTVPRPVLAPSGVSSGSVSPFSRRPSPPRSATPVPTTSGLSFSKSMTDRLKKTNELLNQVVLKLRAQVESLRQRRELQEFELQQSKKKTQEAMTLAAEESAKSKAAKELKEMAERLPPGVYDTENIEHAFLPNGEEPNGVHYSDANVQHNSGADSIASSFLASPTGVDSATTNGVQGPTQLLREPAGGNGRDDHPGARLTNGRVGVQTSNNSVSEVVDRKESGFPQDGENGMKSRNSTLVANSNQVEAEWIEQYEPGVYITLVALGDGTRDLKRVRFSRRRFGEHQCETWWSENREKVYERYNVCGSDKSLVSRQAPRGADSIASSFLACPTGVDSATTNGVQGPTQLLREPAGGNGRDDHPGARLTNGRVGVQTRNNSFSEVVDGKESGFPQDGENGSRNSTLVANSNQVEAEWIEQYEPGVYITLVALGDGTRDLKRVRFSRRRFGEHQAETWWSENREKVYERFNVCGSDKSSVSGQAPRRSEGALSPTS